MKLLLRCALAALLWSPAAALAQNAAEDEAGDVSEVDKDAVGPLRDRVRPVSGHLLVEKGRFELSPFASASFRDAFFTKYLFGLQASYHLADAWAVAARGSYVVPTVSGAAQVCTTSAEAVRGCQPPAFDQLNGRAPGQLTLLAGAELQWAPIYGKVALVAERFAHFKMYGLLGPTFVMYQGPSTVAGVSQGYSTVGGSLGVGFRFVLNRFLALRTELRDLAYVEQVTAETVQFRQQFLFELGFSVFLPTAVQEG
jgi:outer membrane beta-barrel protein